MIGALGATAIAFAMLSGCAGKSGDQPETVGYHAAYPAFATSQELLDSADLVVKGVTVKSRVEKLYPEAGTGTDPQTNPQAGLSPEEISAARADSAVVVTISTVRVQETVKGKVAAGDTIEVSQLGGTLSGVRYQNAETTLLAADGTSYALFLAAHFGKPYDLLNPEQALYVVSADGKLSPARGAGAEGVTDLDTLRSAATGK
jgi:hypothetical protein